MMIRWQYNEVVLKVWELGTIYVNFDPFSLTPSDFWQLTLRWVWKLVSRWVRISSFSKHFSWWYHWPQGEELVNNLLKLMTDQSPSHPARVKAAGGHTNCQGGQLESRGRERTVGICGSRYSADMLFCLHWTVELLAGANFESYEWSNN